MKILLVKIINISLMFSFLITAASTLFMKIHLFKEVHEFFGGVTIWLVFAHIWINRNYIKSVLFKRKKIDPPTQGTTQETPQGT